MASSDQTVLMGRSPSSRRNSAAPASPTSKEATTEQVSVGSIVQLKDKSGKGAKYTLLARGQHPRREMSSPTRPRSASPSLGKKPGTREGEARLGDENFEITASPLRGREVGGRLDYFEKTGYFGRVFFFGPGVSDFLPRKARHDTRQDLGWGETIRFFLIWKTGAPKLISRPV